MSSWTHSICDACYASLEPNRTPYRVTDDWQPPCCWCKSPTSGIYYRYDPKLAQCGGNHAWDLGQCDICDKPAVKVVIGESGDLYFCKIHVGDQP